MQASGTNNGAIRTQTSSIATSNCRTETEYSDRQAEVAALRTYVDQGNGDDSHLARNNIATELLLVMQRPTPEDLNLSHMDADAFNALPDAVGPALSGKVTDLGLPPKLHEVPLWVMRLVPNGHRLETPEFQGDTEVLNQRFEQRFENMPELPPASPNDASDYGPVVVHNPMQDLRHSLLTHPTTLHTVGAEKLQFAIHHRELEAIKILLAAGIGNPKELLLGLPGRTQPIDRAVELIRITLDVEARQRANMFTAITAGSLKDLEALLEKRGDMRPLMISYGHVSTTGGQQTLLSCVVGGSYHLPLNTRQLAMLQYLVEQGVDVHTEVNAIGRTHFTMPALKMCIWRSEGEVRNIVIFKPKLLLNIAYFSEVVEVYATLAELTVRPDTLSLNADFLVRVLQSYADQKCVTQSTERLFCLLKQLPSTYGDWGQAHQAEITNLNQAILLAGIENLAIGTDPIRAASNYGYYSELLTHQSPLHADHCRRKLTHQFLMCTTTRDVQFQRSMLQFIALHGGAESMRYALNSKKLKSTCDNMFNHMFGLLMSRSAPLLKQEATKVLLMHRMLSLAQLFEPSEDWCPLLIRLAEHSETTALNLILGKLPAELGEFVSHFSQHIQTLQKVGMIAGVQTREAENHATALSDGELIMQRLERITKGGRTLNQAQPEEIRSALHIGLASSPEEVDLSRRYTGVFSQSVMLNGLLYDTCTYLITKELFEEWQTTVAPALYAAYADPSASERNVKPLTNLTDQIASEAKKIRETLSAQAATPANHRKAIAKAQNFFTFTHNTIDTLQPTIFTTRAAATLLMCAEMAPEHASLPPAARQAQRTLLCTKMGFPPDSEHSQSIEYHAVEVADLLMALSPVLKPKQTVATTSNSSGNQDVHSEQAAQAEHAATSPLPAPPPVTPRNPPWIVDDQDDGTGWRTDEPRRPNGTHPGGAAASSMRLTLQMGQDIMIKEILRHTPSGRDDLSPKYNQGNPGVFDRDRLNLEFLQRIVDHGTFNRQLHNDGAVRLVYEATETSRVGFAWDKPAQKYVPTNRVRVVVAQNGRIGQVISAYPISQS